MRFVVVEEKVAGSRAKGYAIRDELLKTIVYRTSAKKNADAVCDSANKLAQNV